jgi:hypothetical protein
LLDEGEHEPAGLPEYWQADRCGARPMDLTRKQVERAQAREQKLITPQTSYGAGWQYDYRRCAVGHVVGDFYFRICGEYPVEFDIMKDRDNSGAGFRVASVRIDRADFPAREGDTSHYILGLTEPLLRALARGKRPQVFAEGKAEPVADLRIGDGKKVATFLRRCATILLDTTHALCSTTSGTRTFNTPCATQS